MAYEAVIGLEIHVQLNCTSKMFCDCPNRPGDDPNTNICPICLWLPGAVPMFSMETLEKATLACLGLNCEIQPQSAFDQKVYYYPDLPKGFQLSQHHMPLAKGGYVEIIDENKKPVKLRLHHVHMEEDVAKLVHETEGRTPISLVDFNRAGTPLIEIVTEPCMRNPHDAMEFLKTLRREIRYTGSAECSMEQGTMRCDANISLRPEGSDELNTKVEIKNMNSLHHVGDAIAYEIKRQTESLNNGEPIVLHTRLWNPEKRITTAMRAKSEGPCVPDPTVSQIVVTDEWLKKIAARLPEMSSRKISRFVTQYGLMHDEAVQMSSEIELSAYFEAVIKNGSAPRTAASWISTQLIPAMKEHSYDFKALPVTPAQFAGLINMLEKDEINSNSVRAVLEKLFETDQTPEEIVEQFGFRQVSDMDALESIVKQVIEENPSAVENYKNGNKKSMGFMIGQSMKLSKGKANPKRLQEIFKQKITNS